jgi:hypothetical protein
MRISSGPLTETVKATATALDAQGALPKAPPGALGEKSISELLADGTVKVTVDPKYPQAIGISAITRHTSTFGNSPWEILHNGEVGAQFFTSDFPAAIDRKDLTYKPHRTARP